MAINNNIPNFFEPRFPGTTSMPITYDSTPNLFNIDQDQIQQAVNQKKIDDALAEQKRRKRADQSMKLQQFADTMRMINANQSGNYGASKIFSDRISQRKALFEKKQKEALIKTQQDEFVKNNPQYKNAIQLNTLFPGLKLPTAKDRKIVLQNGIQYYADTGQPVLPDAPAKENNPSTLIENANYIKGLRDDLRNTTDPDKKAIIQQEIDDFAGLGGAYKYTPKVAFDMQQSKTAATQGLVFGERPMNKGEISTDEKFATIYTKYIDDGRGAKNVANLERLNDAEEILKTAAKNGVAISGVTAGMLSGSPRLQALLNEQGLMTEERVASVIQQTLKEILGGQFSEKEGEALIRRGYNASLSPEENLERLLDLKSQVQQLIETEEDSVNYFEKNNKSMRGYKGKTYTEESFARDLSKDYKSDAVELSNDQLKQAYRDAPENSLWEKSLEKELERRSRLGN